MANPGRDGGRPALMARAAHEFPGLAQALSAPQDRRRILKLMAAAFAMSGLGGCDDGAPGGHLIPAVREPPNIIPGLPNFYSTANVVGGYADGHRRQTPDGPANQGRGQSASPCKPRRNGCLRAGSGPGFLRSRSQCRDHDGWVPDRSAGDADGSGRSEHAIARIAAPGFAS